MAAILNFACKRYLSTTAAKWSKPVLEGGSAVSGGHEEPMDRIPGQVGHLTLNADGTVLFSGGELENDEASAEIIMGILNLAAQVDSNLFHSGEVKKLSLCYDDYSYVVCMSNRKIHVVKKLNESGEERGAVEAS